MEEGPVTVKAAVAIRPLNWPVAVTTAAPEMPDGRIGHFDRRILFANVAVYQDEIPGGFQLV